MSADRRLGFLYPPCGAEDELYRYGEQAAPNINVTLIGTRIFGDDDEHALILKALERERGRGSGERPPQRALVGERSFSRR